MRLDRLIPAVQVVQLVMMALSFFGCGTDTPALVDGDPFIELNCPNVPMDQHRSFTAMVHSSRPILVMVDPRFSDDEGRQIQRAVDKWNAFSRERLGRNFFRVEHARADRMPVFNGSLSSCGFTNSYFDNLAIVRDESPSLWTDGDRRAQAAGLDIAEALTVRCPTADKKWINKQVTVVRPGVIQKHSGGHSRFQSAVFHELGHGLGLGHSCADERKGDKPNDKFVSCSGLHADHPYRRAVMFPYLFREQIKEDLSENDLERALCIGQNS